MLLDFKRKNEKIGDTDYAEYLKRRAEVIYQSKKVISGKKKGANKDKYVKDTPKVVNGKRAAILTDSTVFID